VIEGTPAANCRMILVRDELVSVDGTPAMVWGGGGLGVGVVGVWVGVGREGRA
jgi:hypothetical protein